MNNKIIKITVPLLLIITLNTISFAITEGIKINIETISFENKEKDILNIFDSNYNISNNNSNDENYELKQNITELTKKTTYLLLGEANSKKESSENYYKRHKDYLNLRYNPEIPKDDSTFSGLDENSQEYKDDLLSGISLPGMFLQLNELEIKYSSYGEIRVSVINDEMAISMITLKNITMKEQDSTDSTKYNLVQKDLTMYYYFKKLNNEYKLLYLYGETSDDIEEYIEKNDEKMEALSQNEDYNSGLETLYDFSKVNAITDNELTQIYNYNKSKIVYLNSTYNMGSVTSANGFFINEGIIITTYNYIEKTLMKAQYITISDSVGEVYELDGIVTMNKDYDIAILKVKEKSKSYIEIKENSKLEKEDAVITINSKTGVGLKSTKGIITAVDNNIQTSIPILEELQGSPLFDANGNLVGMINSKTINTSISYATNINIIKEYYNKLSAIDFEDIKSIPFQELKEKYYIKYEEENIVNNIPENKWKEYSKLENAEEMIKLKLVKGNYKDKIISLRYKNDILKYIDTMQFANDYIENLKNKGYKEKSKSDSKIIYENKKNQIIIMAEFDYLIIVMVKL